MPESVELVDIERLFASRNTRYATVAFVDLQGQLRGKTVNASKLLAGFPSGVPFSPLNLMMDFGDHTLFPRGYLSPDLDVADNACNIDWQRPRSLPFEESDANLFFLLNLTTTLRAVLGIRAACINGSSSVPPSKA